LWNTTSPRMLTVLSLGLVLVGAHQAWAGWIGCCSRASRFAAHGPRAGRTQPAQGVAEEVLDARAPEGVIAAQLCEHRTDLALLEAHVTKR
jgi:hypothetical protein